MPVIIVVAAVVVVVVLFFWLGFNGLVKSRNRVGQRPGPRSTSSSSVRHDLIPNSWRPSRGTPPTRAGTLEAVTNAAPTRQCAGSEQQAQAEKSLSGALKTLFAVSEAYPDLKANQNFLALQEEAHLDRGSHRVRPAVLQRQRSHLQHQDPEVPDGAAGRYVSTSRSRLLRRRSETTRRCRCSSRRASGSSFGRARGGGPSPRTTAILPRPTGPQNRSFPVYEQIARNKRRTFLILLFFVVWSWSWRYAFDLLFGGGPVAIVIAVVIAVALAWISTSTPTRWPLAASHAKPADEQELPPVPQPVEGLCIAAGLPSRASYVVDDPPPMLCDGRNPKHAAVAGDHGPARDDESGRVGSVLAHELSHIKNYDILVTTVAVTAVGAVALLSDIGLRFRVLGRYPR